MKRSITAALATALVLFLVPLSQAGSRDAILENAIGLPADIAFDGFCDGVHYESGPGGAIHGNATGCLSFSVMGAPGARGGIVHTLNCQSPECIGQLLYIVRSDGTWANFYFDGGVVTPFLTGTWHYGTPAAADAGNRSSASR